MGSEAPQRTSIHRGIACGKGKCEVCQAITSAVMVHENWPLEYVTMGLQKD
jgi:hypothetical protein